MDTSTWKEFKVCDLFDIHPTKSYKKINSELYNDDGKNPVIVNSAFNNGVGGYSTLETTEKGNMITFSDTVDANTIFYQENDFIGYPHVQGLYPKEPYKNKWKKEHLLFFISVFRKSALSKGFDYGNKFRRDIAINIKVKLPTCDNDTPDFEFMEKFIVQLNKKILQNFNKINILNRKEQSCIDITKWKKFHLYDENLFTIDSGSKLDRVKMTEENPTVLFIGRSNNNNGITALVDEIKGLSPYEAGNLTLSLGGEYLGSCFIQEKPFYTSQNTIVLKPNRNIPKLAKQFIATSIFRESRHRYKAFIDELNRHIKTDFSFYLPVREDETPDFEYMENFMKNFSVRVSSNLNNLISIL